jgi:hypothetical protein
MTYAYWLRNEIKHADLHARRTGLAEVVSSKEFYLTELGEML